MNDEKIVLIARLKINKDSVEAAKQAALELVEPSRAETGCINYDFHQQIDDETIFIWLETWANRAAIDSHGDSAHFKKFSRTVEDMTEEPLQLTFAKMVSVKVENK